METPQLPEAGAKRLVSRGRRSSILLRQDDASPTVISAPINDSIQGRTANEQIAQIKARLTVLAEYKAKLEEEKEEWYAVVTKFKEKQSALETHSNEKNMQKIEAKASKLLDDVGHRPEHILIKTFNQFQETMGNSAEKLRKEIAALKIDYVRQQQNIEIAEKRKEHLGNIIKERSEEDFAKKVDIWTKARAFSQKNLEATTKFMETCKMYEEEVEIAH